MAVGNELIFFIAASLEHALLPNYGPGLPAALWICRRGEGPRLFWRLTPLVYVRILEQLDILEQRWVAGDETLTQQLATAVERMQVVFRWATEHFTEEEMKAARASAAPMPRPTITKDEAQAIDDPALAITLGPRFDSFEANVEPHNQAAAERWYRKRHQETQETRERRQKKQEKAKRVVRKKLGKQAAVGAGGLFSSN